MANPRNAVAFDNIGYDGTTFKYDGTITFDRLLPGASAMKGKAVTMTGNGQVGLTQDGDEVKGQLVTVDSDGFCTVQEEGYCKLPAGVSAALTIGAKIVGALGPGSARGYIRAVPAATGSYVQGTAGDALKARHEIVDASDTANVVIELE